MLVSLAAVAIVGLVLKSLMSKPVDLVAEAKEGLDCAKRGDAGCLASKLGELEVSEAGWNRSNLDYVYREIIVPFWSSHKEVGAPETQRLTWQGIASQKYQLRNGYVYERPVDTASDGRKAFLVVSHDLYQTFHAMVVEKYGESARETSGALAWVEGLERYGPDLLAHGIKGIVFTDPRVGTIRFKTIAQAIADGRRKLATIRSKVAAQK